jgi:hypothetical protein
MLSAFDFLSVLCGFCFTREAAAVVFAAKIGARLGLEPRRLRAKARNRSTSCSAPENMQVRSASRVKR